MIFFSQIIQKQLSRLFQRKRKLKPIFLVFESVECCGHIIILLSIVAPVRSNAKLKIAGFYPSGWCRAVQHPHKIRPDIVVEGF